MNIKIILESHPQWSAVEKIFSRLQAQGYEVFLAGGCVRDALLGRVPNDLDVATDARPEMVEKFFEKTVSVGKSFGVIRVIVDDADIEVATFRTDGEYKDGRRPEGVVFSSPREDAQRRDFTVNALFYDLKSSQVLDFVQGLEDIKKKCLRTVGIAEHRFSEDHLRLLRAARFVAQLDFNLENETERALTKMAAQVGTVSGERLREEMDKLLKSTSAKKGLQLMQSSGLMAELFPFYDEKIGFFETQQQDCFDTRESWQRFCLFFRSASSEALRDSLLKLRFSNKEKNHIQRVLKLWSAPGDFFSQSLGWQLHKYSDEDIAWGLSFLKIQGKYFEQIERLQRQLQIWGGELPDPFLKGDDVHFLQGKARGLCLEEAFYEQLQGTLRSREGALAWLKKFQKDG